MIKRLHLKFIAINTGITAILLSTILGLVFYFASANLEIESIHMTERITNQSFQVSTPGGLRKSVRLPFFTLRSNPHDELLDANGSYYDLFDDAFLGGLTQAVAVPPRRLGVPREYNLRYYRSGVPMSRLLVSADISNERATLDGLCKTRLPIGGLSLLAFPQVSVLPPKWVTYPVEQTQQQQRQFIAAISHKLRTSLTVIMTNAELPQDKTNEARRSTFSSNILTMSRQMRVLIEQILELTRVDSAKSHLTLRPANFNGLTTRNFLPPEPLSFEQGLTLISQVDERITVSGGEEALRRMLEILLDDTQKYSSLGGETQVTLHRRGRNHCAPTVANQGEPIPPEARRQIFQHFYRANPTRSRNGNFGLGLSIAEGTVAQHHGTIDVTCAGGSNRFQAELPCQQEQRRRSKPRPEVRE